MADPHRYQKYRIKSKQTCIYNLPPEIIEIILRQTSYRDLLNIMVVSKKMNIYVYHILRKIFEISFGKCPVYNIFRDQFDFLLKSTEACNVIIAQAHKFSQNLEKDGIALCSSPKNCHHCNYDYKNNNNNLTLSIIDYETPVESPFMCPEEYIEEIVAYGIDNFISDVNSEAIKFCYSGDNECFQIYGGIVTEKVFEWLIFLNRIAELGGNLPIYFYLDKSHGWSCIGLEFDFHITQDMINKANED